MAALEKRFSGQSLARLDTYAGKMDVLKKGVDEATKAIGTGLVDALVILSKDKSVESLADNFENLGDNIAYAIVEMAKLIKKFDESLPKTIQSKVNYFIDSYNSSISEIIEKADDAKFENSINDTSTFTKQSYSRSVMKSVTDMDKYYKEILEWMTKLSDKDVLYYVPRLENLLQIKKNIMNDFSNITGRVIAKENDIKDVKENKEKEVHMKSGFISPMKSAMKDCWEM
jgi:ribosomal protein L7Ae-like RNA K-turn-binding protein